MDKMIEIRGVKYNAAVEWTEKSFAEVWKANKKLRADMQVAKDRDKAMKEDWEKLKQFLPKKPKAQPRQQISETKPLSEQPKKEGD